MVGLFHRYALEWFGAVVWGSFQGGFRIRRLFGDSMLGICFFFLVFCEAGVGPLVGSPFRLAGDGRLGGEVYDRPRAGAVLSLPGKAVFATLFNQNLGR